MSLYNFSSVDPEHYNRIRATIPNHFLSRSVNICVSTLTSNCNIEVMNEQDYIEFEITKIIKEKGEKEGEITTREETTKHKIFMEQHSKLSPGSFADIVQELFERFNVPITISCTNLDTIRFTSDHQFSILDMSYNMKMLCGFYCLEDSQWPIKSVETKIGRSYFDQKDKPLTSIKFEALEIREGDYTSMIIEKEPPDANGFSITYTNPDETKLTIDEYGVIYGIKAGDVDIKAEIRNPGHSEYAPPDFTKTVEIRVIKREKLTIQTYNFKDYSPIKLYKTQTKLLRLNISPHDADYSATLTSSNPDIVAISGADITALQVGTVEIKAHITNEGRDSFGRPVNQELDMSITVIVLSDWIEETKQAITSKSVGYYLSTPILYLLTNVGNHVFFNEMHNSKRLQCGTVCMCLNNSYSASFPIIASQGEIITRCSIGHVSDIWFILVDANMKEVKLLNPMYITVSVRPDESDPATTPGLL